MTNKKAVQIIGYKNSGKTHLMVNLCSMLKSRGLRVGCIKYSHHSLDKRDSDTEKLSNKADVVVGISPSSSQVFFNKKKSFLDVLTYLDVDIILIEGGRREIDFLPRIVVANHEEDIELTDELTIGVYLRNKDLKFKDHEISFIDKEENLVEDILNKGFLLPGIDCGACGYNSCREMGIKILKNEESVQSCMSMNTPEVKVEVDGVPLNLNPFVQNIVKSTIEGLLSNLKGYHKGEINIQIKTK